MFSTQMPTMTGAGNSFQVSYMGGRHPITWTVTTASQGSHKQKAGDRSQNGLSNLGTLMWEIGIITNNITTSLGILPWTFFKWSFSCQRSRSHKTKEKGGVNYFKYNRRKYYWWKFPDSICVLISSLVVPLCPELVLELCLDLWVLEQG